MDLHKHQNGFTLLELIVVMVLVSLTMSMVGPRLYRSLDNYRADAEERAFMELLEKVSYQSFFQRKRHILNFDRNHIAASDEKVIVYFDFLEFPKQLVAWNANGFASVPDITYHVQGRAKKLPLH